MQARKGEISSKPENPVNAIKAKQAFYAMCLLSVILCFIVGAAGCIGGREPASQEGELNFTVIPEKTRVAEGEVFDIGLFLKNTGSKNINVWKMEEQVSYDIFFLYPNGSYVFYECGVIERVQLTDDALIELQPGEFLQVWRDSSCWTLPPGVYTLFTEYHTSSGESITKPYWIGRARSNNVTIFVEAENNSSLLEPGSSSEKGAVEELNAPDAPLTIAVSALVEYLSPEDLANKSYLILIGSVKEILPARWNTPDGKQPENAFEGSGLNDVIYRDVVISVDQYFKNPLSSNEVIVRVLGGTVGNLTLDVEDEPSFESGEDVLLFLVEDTKPATKDLEPEHFRVTGSFQGKYALTGDGKAVKSGETAELEELLRIIDDGNQS
ncbi:hypothetical protein [Methanosarcina sp. KYL-1]|uniref:hypothetical protein n=1 Tax=Methanosarcina sp. KYL-1 TaxID=2602068 RepID=UPI002101551D|nr:hypothetical protein [Methanosarcina sp. KYL-1]